MELFRRWIASLAACLISAAMLGCGGGGGADATTPAAAPQVDTGWPLQAVQGQGHITVYWAAQSAAQVYEVWVQEAGQSSAKLSRRLTATTSTTATWVHTVTELTPDSSHRVWVRMLSASGAVQDSQVLERNTSRIAASGSASEPSFMPSSIDTALLVIDTDGAAPIVDRDNYMTATFNLYANSADRSAGLALAAGRLELRGRDNTTWELHPKKPYRLKLASSTSLLGMPANRHWVLLANHSDKTLLRNQLAFEVSRRMGMPYTPRSQVVQLQLNGQYLGSYDLVEHVRTGTSRVNIAALGSSAADDLAPLVSGGYLLEVDRNDAETRFVSSTCGLPVRIHAPESPSTAQLSYINQYLNQAEAALMSSNFADPSTGYAAWIDVDNWVDWYLHSELMHHIDAFRHSTYLHKDRSGKLKMGPVWDFDLAMGNHLGYFSTRSGRTDGLGSASTRCWFARLLQDPAFVQRVRQRWATLRGTSLSDLNAHVQTHAALLTQSAQVNNFSRWPVLDRYLWQNVVVTGSYAGEIEYLQWWLQRRLQWMDEHWRP